MKIDRRIIKWSDTETFQAATYVEIYNMLLNNYRAIYGSEVDFSAESPIGQELRMKAEMFRRFAELGEYMYYTLDINHAHGPMLDNYVAFTSNLQRLTNRSTRIKARITTDKILANGQIYFIQDSEDVRWRVTDFTGQDGTYEVELVATNYGELTFTLPAVQILRSASFLTSTVAVTELVYSEMGSIKETDAMLRMRRNNMLSYNSTSILDSIRDHILKNIHSIRDVVIYNSNGRGKDSIEVVENFNSKIKLLISDKEYIDNKIESTGQTDEVVDNVIKLHDVLVIVQPQIGLELDAFIDIKEVEGDTPEEDETIITPKSLSVSIAETIRQKLTPGIATSFELLDYNSGGTPLALTDINYISVNLSNKLGSVEMSERISFYVSNSISPEITITLLKRNNYDATSNRKKIREAVYNLSKTYTINKDIDLAELYSVVQSSNIDPLQPTFVVSNIVITGGVKVNNGYWLVNRIRNGSEFDYPDIKIVEIES